MALNEEGRAVLRLDQETGELHFDIFSRVAALFIYNSQGMLCERKELSCMNGIVQLPKKGRYVIVVDDSSSKVFTEKITWL